MVTSFEEEAKKRVVWEVTHEADPDGRKLADNHYSRKTKGAKSFVGPGEKLVLITPDKQAWILRSCVKCECISLGMA